MNAFAHEIGLAAALVLAGDGFVFGGSWSPTCKPSAADRVKNDFRTVFFEVDGSHFNLGDWSCSTSGWKSLGGSLKATVSCEGDGVDPYRGPATITPRNGRIQFSLPGQMNLALVRCGSKYNDPYD